MQRSSIDHLVWNGAANPQCHLATSGLFTTDHVPVIVNTAITTASKITKITLMKHNVTLDNSDKGAVRRFISRTKKLADKMGDGLSSLSLPELTKASVDIVRDIHNRRHTKRNPEIWSPISRLLSLRLSALGSTVKLGTKGDCRPLQQIITKLRRDEKGIILNEDEIEWLESNDIAADPYDWSEWKNCYHTTSITSTEFLRTRTLLSNENKKEYRRI